MTPLDQKINVHFPGLAVRKDLAKTVKGNAIVPSYVLEYLLGQYCATSDEASIQSGIETVKEILRHHYVHRNEAGLIRSHIREKGRYKIIDKASVALNDKEDVYEATFANLGINKVLVNPSAVKTHPKLLVSGVWCIADIEYEFSEDAKGCPWILGELKPIQISQFDLDSYLAARRQFTTEEWLDLLIQSIGFNPALLNRRGKLLQLIRLIPFCERNYNLIELGPKGTGKSHIYSEFSPHGILISGGEVTSAKLFVNNATGKVGLVGYWDCVAFDEFAGKQKRVDKALVDIMKNYMANKSFSRGVETLGAEASMVFVGNTQRSVPQMLRHSNLFDELPSKFYDSAFLDRIHFYIPGWEVDVIRGEMFATGYGFVVDYLAEILRVLRNCDYSDRYQSFFSLSADLSTRDRDGIHKTFSGLMKVIFPHQEATKEEIKELLQFAIEGRKRVKDQLLRIDSTYPNVNFAYLDSEGKLNPIKTLEEVEYPQEYYLVVKDLDSTELNLEITETELPASLPSAVGSELSEKHLTFQENQQGVSFDKLFGAYLQGAQHLIITDPYIRIFFQIRNLMEFLETVAKYKSVTEEVTVRLLTTEDDNPNSQQRQCLERIKASAVTVGIQFFWTFDNSGTMHARHIQTNHGWKILLDRGLDIFQHYDLNDTFSFNNRLQQFRKCKAFEITYLKNEF
ncbi:MAG: BREX system Lon protease-like protein BrxL [Cyanobacteriota bacterium]|jgi:ATP-dependent Lon protease